MKTEYAESQDLDELTKYFTPPHAIHRDRHKLLLLVTAIASIVITFGITFAAMEISRTKVAPQNNPIAIGSVLLSPNELVRQVTTLRQNFYWLGPVDNSVYSTLITPTEDVLIYWPAGTSSINFNLPRRVVRTYLNLTAYSASALRTNMPSDLTTYGFAFGKMQYSSRDMSFMTVFLSGDSRIVEVQFAQTQTEAEMVTEAQSLKLIA